MRMCMLKISVFHLFQLRFDLNYNIYCELNSESKMDKKDSV